MVKREMGQALNKTKFGLILTGIGVLSNKLVIGLNGGMPTPFVGREFADKTVVYVPAKSSVFGFLGDCINIGNDSYSVGDLLIYAGLVSCVLCCVLWLLERERVRAKLQNEV